MPNPMISPGVRVNVVDQSQYTGLAGTPTNPICIIGAAQMGPTMEPVLLSSITQFLNTFGTPIDLAGLTATKSLKAGGTIYYFRLADGTQQVKTVTLPGAESPMITTFQVDGVTVTEEGSGYLVGDELSTSNGETPATFKVISTDGIGTTYGVDTVTIATGGSNYVVGDVLTLDNVTGTAATLTVAEINAESTTWQVSGATVSDGGSGYAIGDTLTVSGAQNATFTVSSVNATSPSYSLKSLTVTDGGSGYVVGDTLTLSGSTDASIKVDEVTSGVTTYKITGATVASAGDGYAVDDTLTIQGENSNNFVAKVTAITPSYTISGFTVTNGGENYQNNENLTATIEGKSIALVAKVESTTNKYKISSATIAEGGSGYAVNDTVTVSVGDTDTVAYTFTVATVSESGAIESVTYPDTLYDTEPSFTASETSTSGSGTGATLTVGTDNVTTLAVGSISSVEYSGTEVFDTQPPESVTNLTGSTYGSGAVLGITNTASTTGPIATISVESEGEFSTDPATNNPVTPTNSGSGTGATLTVVSSSTVNGAGVITKASITVPGSFIADPAGVITPTGGSGSGAKFTVTTEASTYGVITGVNLTSAGSFTSNPQGPATPTGGSGTGAELTLTSTQIDGGVITKLEIASTGTYTQNPAGEGISVSGGSGSGATVNVTSTMESSGGITSLSVETPGSFMTDPAGEGVTLTGGHGVGVKVTLVSKEVEVPVGGSNLILTATSAGTLAEGTWYASVSQASGNTFVLQIVRIVGTNSPVNVVGPITLSLTPNDPNYYKKFTGNGLFTLESDTDKDPIEMSNTTGNGLALSAGSNGATPDDPTANVSAITQAVEILGDPESYNFLFITSPVYSSAPATANLLKSLATTRDNSMVQIDHPSSVETVDDIVKSLNNLVEPNASQVALWGGLNLVTTDEYNNNSLIRVPPSVVIIPALASLYSTADPWTPPASINQLELTELKSATSFSLTQRDTLYQANINPLTNYRNLGWTSMGQKTAQSKKTALDRINVRLLVNIIKIRLANMSVDFLFSPIDQQTFDNWVYRANQILAQIAQRRGLYDYLVKLDFETTTQEDINNNIMRPIVQIKPSKVAEYIDIDLIIRNYSDTWDPES